MTQAKAGTVYFIGAGPGAADLITVRGRNLIAQADLVLYADSLVAPEAVAAVARPDARLIGSAALHLDEIMALLIETARRGEVVARVHSGDPSIYGAIHEQMVRLEEAGIPYEIVPGVASTFAAAARLGVELTVPNLVQTVILTRAAGRVPMPPKEQLRDLAAHGATLAIHLGVTRIRQVVEELLAGGAYSPATPVAVVHRVTWPDESYVLGTLADIADKVRAAGYTRQALILVTPALDPALRHGDGRAVSHLYDQHYTHRFRKAAQPSPEGERPSSLQAGGDVNAAVRNAGPICIAVTRRGAALAQRLAAQIQGEAAVPARLHTPSQGTSHDTSSLAPLHRYADSALAEVRRRWSERRPLILIMATGIAVRAVAPLLSEKQNDPGVLCLDEQGRFVIPLLGGHQAEANRLAKQIAALTGGTAVITTASDGQDKPALDRLAEKLGWRIDPESALTHTMARLVNDDLIGLWIDPRTPIAEVERLRSELAGCSNVEEIPNPEALKASHYTAGILATPAQVEAQVAAKSLIYRPPALVAGIGCRRGATLEALEQALRIAFQEAGLSLYSLAALATAEPKADEPGLRQLADALQVPLHVIPATRLQQLHPASFTASAAQEKLGLPGVAEPCAVLVANGPLLAPKRRFDQCTVAIALRNQEKAEEENA